MLEFEKAGFFTTVQDYPGRVGYWHVGIPPSGPMDPMAFRMANVLVGNSSTEAGLELTTTGPTIRFHCDAVVALTGGAFEASLDGVPVPFWTALEIWEGSVLRVGRSMGPGARAYLAVQGGIDVPEYLGSKSTFHFGSFGGFNGRTLQDGDKVALVRTTPDPSAARSIARKDIPDYADDWRIGAIVGPYAAPDYFTVEDVRTFFDTEFTVSHNANRLGYRLDGGTAPEFARESGGGGGRHPSNVHDYVYAVGAVNFTGDTPIIIGPDGPSLGGFVCMVTIPSAELWKVGQAKAGDRIHFRAMSIQEAVRLRKRQDNHFARIEARKPQQSTT